MKPPLISFAALTGMPVYKDKFLSKVDEEGNKVLARVWEGKVLVHPDHWDEFVEKLRGIANTPGGGDEP